MGSAAASSANIDEMTRLLGLAQRARTREALQAELDMLRAAAAAKPPAATPTALPVPAPIAKAAAPPPTAGEFANINNYAWDHGNKWVKVYLTLPGLEKVPDEQIEAQFGERSLRVSISGLSAPPTNRRLAVPVLCSAVRAEQCSWVRKPSDMLLVKLRKAEDGEEWGSLDDSSAKKEEQRKERVKTNQDKSTAELLAQMYAEADEDGKVALSKAWEEGREKREAKRQPS